MVHRQSRSTHRYEKWCMTEFGKKGGVEGKGVLNERGFTCPAAAPSSTPWSTCSSTRSSFYMTAHWEQRAMPCWPDNCSYDVYNFSRADVHTLI